MGYAAFSIFTLLIFWWGYRRTRPLVVREVRCEHPPEFDEYVLSINEKGHNTYKVRWKKWLEDRREDDLERVKLKTRVAQLSSQLTEAEDDVDSLELQLTLVNAENQTLAFQKHKAQDEADKLELENQQLWAANKKLWDQSESTAIPHWTVTTTSGTDIDWPDHWVH